MPQQSSAQEKQSVLPGKMSAVPKRHRRRLLQIGCLPITLILTACLLLFVNLVAVSRAPTWVSDPEEYLLAQRITGSLGALAGLQIIGTWLLGVVAAATAAGAAAGQGGLLRKRLAVLRRRVVPAAWAIFILRVLVLIALAISAVLIYPYLVDFQGTWTDFRIARRPHISEIVTALLTLVTVLLHWLSGPFLRLRYSMALGAWGASWTRFRSRRVWMALTARMGAGMCGSLALLWSSLLGVLVLLTIGHPFSRSDALDFRRVLFPFLPRDSWESIVLLAGLSVAIILYMVGQLALPRFYLWMARRWLAGRPPAVTRRWLDT